MLPILITLMYKGVQIYSGMLVVYALLSWFPGAYDSGFGRLLSRLCEPYLSLFDRFNLRIGMVGFNIMVGIIVLNLAAGGLAVILQSFI